MNVKFVIHSAEMNAQGVDADAKIGGDFFVNIPFGQGEGI
jgi:hypothetical protein